MDVVVLEAVNAPPRPLIAVRSGAARRQMRMRANHAFQISEPPSGLAAKALEVTLFHHLASFAIPAETPQTELVCNVPVRNVDGSSSEVKLRVKPERPKGEAAADGGEGGAESRDYLDKHELEKRVQELIQDVLTEQPSDPFGYMRDRLRRQRSAPEEEVGRAVAAGAATGSEADAAVALVAEAVLLAAPASRALAAGLQQAAGVYLQEGLAAEGAVAGVRMVSCGRAGASDVTVVGSDDGVAFWAAVGRLAADGELLLDLSAAGGASEARGACKEGRVDFAGGATWSKISRLEDLKGGFEPATDALPGLYMDQRHAQAGAFAGARLIAESAEGGVTVVGTDDGADFWTLAGSKQDGALEIDFGPRGGQKVAAKIAGGCISFEDGASWSRHSSAAASPAPAG